MTRVLTIRLNSTSELVGGECFELDEVPKFTCKTAGEDERYDGRGKFFYFLFWENRG